MSTYWVSPSFQPICAPALDLSSNKRVFYNIRGCMAYCLAFQRLFRQLGLSSTVPARWFPVHCSFASACFKAQMDCPQGFRTFNVTLEPIIARVIGCKRC
jgi:hypothetical protein